MATANGPKLFDLPDKRIVQITLNGFFCEMCGYTTTKSVHLTLIASDCYMVLAGIRKRGFMKLVPGGCNCTDGIWLEDGPVPPPEKERQ